MTLTPQIWYFWNFRTAVNVRLKMVKRNEHKPQFVHMVDERGKEFCVHEDCLSLEKK